jgi:glucokinase
MMMDRILGVDIGGTNIKLGIVGADGTISESGMIDTNAGEGPGRAADRVAAWYKERKGSHPAVVAAGIDSAGLIDGSRGILYTSPNLPGWENVPLAEIFSNRLGLPVTLDNDVNCAAWGEYRMGAGRGTSSFVALTLGTGVGGGVVMDGRIYRGWQGLAGEVGHHVIDRNGRTCVCGNRGCLEAMVNAQSILDRMEEAIEKNPACELASFEEYAVEDISNSAKDGDEAAVAVLAETGRLLGIGLANIVHFLNPEVIAVGGGISGAGDLILEPARETMKEMLMGDILHSVKVVTAELGNRASFVGAALLALENI